MQVEVAAIIKDWGVCTLKLVERKEINRPIFTHFVHLNWHDSNGYPHKHLTVEIIQIRLEELWTGVERSGATTFRKWPCWLVEMSDEELLTHQSNKVRKYAARRFNASEANSKTLLPI